MTILRNKWVLLALALALSIGLFLAVASFDKSRRYESSSRRAASQMERCTEGVRQGVPGTEEDCIRAYAVEANALDARDRAAAMMVGGMSVAGLWVVFAILYFLRRRRPDEA